MGFQEILVAWRASGRDVEADRVVSELTVFRADHPQVFENLDSDPSIDRLEALRPGSPDAIRLREALVRISDGPGAIGPREALLECILGDPDHVAKRIEEFCHGLQCFGLADLVAQEAWLGRATPRRRFEELLTSVRNPTSPFTRRRSRAAPSVDEILGLDLERQRRRLRRHKLGRFLMWCFYQPESPQDPFQGISCSAAELDRRLGLENPDADRELVFWAHQLREDQTAHTPTAFDAELMASFRPGGQTRPPSGDDGLPEVVHRPIPGDQLTQPIQAAR